MANFVFYCTKCKQAFVGQDMGTEDRPLCPNCNKETIATGIEKDAWLEYSKEEREAIIEGLKKDYDRREEEKQKKADQRKQYADSVGVDYRERDEKRSSSSFIEFLYGNIGGKLKGAAFVSFVVEALGAVIGGIVLASSSSEDMILPGLLIVLFGPCAAWVASWMLYAFGELVEKAVANEEHSNNILKLLLEIKANKDDK